jgi:hypothetical protein
MELKGFQATAAEGVALSSDDPDGSPLLERKEDFVSALPVGLHGAEVRCELPPHSIAFVTLRR